MHTTIYEGVKETAREEYADITHKLAIAFNVTPDELEHALHKVGLFVTGGDDTMPWNVGIRRLPRQLKQRLNPHV